MKIKAEQPRNNKPEYKCGFGNGPRLLTPSARFSASKFPWMANSSGSCISARTTPYKNVSSSIAHHIAEACFLFSLSLSYF